MKITIVQYGSDEEIFPLLSLVIGLHKKYPKCEIIWAGDPFHESLIKYNKRISQFLDVTQEFSFGTLKYLFGTDICINTSTAKIARDFASKCLCKNKIKPSNFFHRVMEGDLKTNKTILQIYYDLAELRWQGEGYGIGYYPSTKQTEKTGTYISNGFVCEGTVFTLPENILKQLDTINQFEEIVTDDIFVAHASISLKKNCTFVTDGLPYRLEFFGKGKRINV